ncbi:23S rRNA (uracil(1939)-C(5))-methyltransferase RlmD [Candidatus Berkelbacteria bacterium]|nr:23S rRNA (uracil(1939)-C(5))-methyltransferase RlmD [Candidatus Berkelbacteria bacterium]
MPEIEITTTGLVAGGDAIGRLPDGRAVFVAGGAPNETVRIELIKEDKRWAKAQIAEILAPSPDRIEPEFERPILGGATWAHIAYSAQLTAKEQIVCNALERIGGLDNPNVRPIVASPEQWGYRNRIELTFGEADGELVLGTLKAGSDTQVESAEGSALFGEGASPLIERVLAWARGRNSGVWKPRERRGALRNLILRRGIHTGDLVVNLVTTSAAQVDRSLVAELQGLPVSGVLWSLNDAGSSITRFDQVAVLTGHRRLEERVLDLDLVYDATSFFQGNVGATERLLEELRGQMGAVDELVDLYAGVGLLGLSAAGSDTALTLVESNPQAVQDAKANTSALKRLDRTTIVQADAVTYLDRERMSSDATVIVDPPRTGLEREVINGLLRDQPARLIYVSCDPATLARDLKLLGTAYQPTFIQPFDFFPQTPHVETLVVLQLKL